MRSLSGEERRLLFIQTFDVLAYMIASVFVTLFFFSHSDLATTALFRAVAFASMTFFFALSGKLLRHVSSGTLIRLGIGGGALYFLLLFLLREESIRWFVPLGVLDGFTGGVFWAGFNLNQYILSSAGRRVAYFGWGQALFQLAVGLGPAIGGGIITIIGSTAIGKTGGYITLFIVVSLLLALVAVLVGRLPGHEIPVFRYRHILYHRRSRLWNIVLAQQAVLGLYDVALGTVLSILYYLIVQHEGRLGLMYSIGALIAALSSVAVTRLLVRFPHSFWIGAAGSALAITLFASQQNLIGVWSIIIISSLTVPFMMTMFSTAYFDALDRAPGAWQHKFHLMIERDGLLAIFRMISYLVLFALLQVGDEIAIARTMLFVLPAFPLAIGVLLQLSTRLQKEVPPAPSLPSEIV